MAISGGFVEVGREQVAVLAETAERIEEIDVERGPNLRASAPRNALPWRAPDKRKLT